MKKNPFYINTEMSIEFLSRWFGEGASYGTLNCARSALALLAPFVFSEDARLRRFLRVSQDFAHQLQSITLHGILLLF